MKKIISIITILFATFALYSCFSVTDSLEITSIPKLEFNQNENFPLEAFVEGLKLSVNGGPEFSASTATTSVSGFDLSQAPGVYTATVSYAAGGVSASATFMYTIRPAKETYGFADYIEVGGIHIYTISNVNHFRNIAIGDYEGKNDPTTHFILSNDLDFENTSPWIGYENEITEYRFTGTFDGNNHTIKNLHSTESIIFNKSTSTSSTTSLFFEIESATFKNITFDNCVVGNVDTKGIGLLGFGLGEAEPVLAQKHTRFICDNITINSNCKIIGSYNAFGLVGYAPYETFLCSNYVFNGQAISSGYGAGSIASFRTATAPGGYNIKEAEFINCEIGGIIQASGTQSSAFFTNQLPSEKILFRNCNITSTIFNSHQNKTDLEAGWFIATSKALVGTLTYDNCNVSGTYYLADLDENSVTSFDNIGIEKYSSIGNYVDSNANISAVIPIGILSFNNNLELNINKVNDAKYYVVTCYTSFQLYQDGNIVSGSTGKVNIATWKFTEVERATKIIKKLETYSITGDISEVGWFDNNYITYRSDEGLNARIFVAEKPTVTYKLIAYNSAGEPIAILSSNDIPISSKQS